MTTNEKICAVDVRRERLGTARRIVRAYEQARANMRAAAEILGLARSTVDRYVFELERYPSTGISTMLEAVRRKYGSELISRRREASRKGGLVGHGGRPKNAKSRKKGKIIKK